MLPSWSGVQFEQTNRVLDGSGDDNIFLFYFKNVVMIGKDATEKSLELIVQLDTLANILYLKTLWCTCPPPCSSLL